jgi:hypothetical protein
MPPYTPAPIYKTGGSNIYVKVFEKYFFGFFLPENTTPFPYWIQNPKKYFSVKKFRDFEFWGDYISIYIKG